LTSTCAPCVLGLLGFHRPNRKELTVATTDRSLIWTGPINDAARIGGSVGLYDTTLRDGEQTVGVVFDPEQKLELARAIDHLGIDRIEAGYPRVSQDDWDAVQLIAGAGLRAEVWGFSRDRIAHLRREAGRARGLARDDARADP
jgi:hydroxymethylglutaryl-coenzyme A lyase family protein